MVRQTEARAPRRCLAKKKEALCLPYFLILAADVVEEYFAASKAAATDEGWRGGLDNGVLLVDTIEKMTKERTKQLSVSFK